MKSSFAPMDRHAPALLLGAILAVHLSVGSPNALGSAGAWTRKADLPEIRAGAAAGAIDGVLYVAAGNTAALTDPKPRTLYAYDPRTDVWSRKADIPTGRELPSAGVVDGILYVVGGLIGSATAGATSVTEAYDPRTDTWTSKAALPTPRADVTGCVLDGLLYAVGGWEPGRFLSTVECYDPKTDRWTRKASLPVEAEIPAVQVVNGIMYAFVDQQCFAYDAATDTWAARANLPADQLQVRATAAGAVDGWVYLLGGLLRPSLCGSDAALAYDPLRDRYVERAPLPANTAVAASVVLGGKIYVIGGASGVPPSCPEGRVFKSLWVYDPNARTPPPGTWTRKANLPATRVGAAAGEIDGVLYVAAGNTAPVAQPQPKTLFAYNPQTDVWTRKADIPTGREITAAGVIDGIFYVAGGLVGANPTVATSAVEAYDPKTDQWTRKASMLTARGDVTGCVLEGQLYAIGGWTSGGLVSTVECYDPKTDRWTRKANLPVVAEVPAVQVVNGRIYAFVEQQTFAYDPTTDTWTSRVSLPAGKLQARTTATGSVDGWVYLMGGLVRPSQCGSDAMMAYDPVADRFTELPALPTPTAVAASAVLGGKIYVAGGASGFPPTCPNGVVGNELWTYTPERPETPVLLSLNLEADNRIRLCWRSQIGRRYGVESTLQLARSAWACQATVSGATLIATETVMEAVVPIPDSEGTCFFRVIVTD